MDTIGFIFAIQVLILIAALPVCALSFATSRGRVSQHRTAMAMGISLAFLALMGLLTSLAMAVTNIDTVDWLELGPPILTFVLCGLTVWRASGKIRGHRRRRAARGAPSTPSSD